MNDSNDSKILYYKSLEYFNKGEFDDSFKFLDKIELNKSSRNTIKIIKLYNKLGKEFIKKGWHIKAINCHEKILQLCINKYGEKHSYIARQYKKIAEIYVECEDYENALTYLKKMIPIYENSDQKDMVGDVYNNIINIYIQYQPEQNANLMLEYAIKLASIEEELKTDTTLLINLYDMILIACSYVPKEKNEDIAKIEIEFLFKLLKIYKEKKDTANIIVTLMDISNTYKEAGKKTKALRYRNKALEMKITEYEKKHGSLITVNNNINRIYNSYKAQADNLLNRGKYEKALELYQKVLFIKNEISGEKSIETAVVLSNIGEIYYNLGSFYESVEYYEKSLLVRIELMDDKSKSMATLYNNIGAAYNNINSYDEAIKSYKKSLDIRLLINDSPQSLAILFNNIAVAYESNGRKDLSKEYYEKNIEMYMLMALENKKNNEHTMALNYLRKALDIRIRISGEEDFKTAELYEKIGLIYKNKENLNICIENYKKALKIRILLLGEFNKRLIPTYRKLGLIFEKVKNYKEAIKFYERILDIMPTEIFSLARKGKCLIKLGNYGEAKTLFDKIFEINPKFSKCSKEIKIMNKKLIQEKN